MSVARIKVKPASTTTRRASRKKSAAPEQPSLSHDAIAREAYLIWELRGRPEDRALEHWLEAEQRLTANPNALSA